jgi:hypothetical protein
MAQYSFAYTVDPDLEYSPAFPEGRSIIRPILNISLVNGDKRVSGQAIVDCGADYCLFPISWMQLLGIDPSTAPLDTSTGVGAQVSAHFYNVTMEIAGIPGSFPVYAGFPTKGPLTEMNVGFLGYLGFVDRFFVILDGPRGRFGIQD